MLLMLTPTLACAMTFCPMQEAVAAQAEPEHKSCHDMMEPEKEEPSSLMFMLDCMGVDLFQQDHSFDIRPDMVLSDIDHVWGDFTSEYNFRPENINAIRDPPDKHIELRGQPSLIHITQRFRN